MRYALLATAVAVAMTVSTVHGGEIHDIFVGDSPAELTLSAPLDDLFARAEHDSGASVKGTLTLHDAAAGRDVTLADIVVSERGHTSRQSSECAFPKLKLDLARVDRAGTPFEGIAVLKLGTHCGDSHDGELTPKYGRLANDLAPRREALVYRLLQAAGVPTLRARQARVTYSFTGTAGREPLTRFAMLLEDDGAARKRLGADGDIEESAFGAAREQFRPEDTARLAFAEAMIGNFDWCLRMFQGDIYRCDDRHPLWNVLAFTHGGGQAFPVPYDFDLSGPVVGRHVWFRQVFDAGFTQPPSSAQVEVQSQVQRTRSLFERAVLDQTRAQFLQARPAVLAAIDSSDVDTEGAELARRYVGAFFDAIEQDDRFYMPVVTEGGHTAFLDAGGTRPACGDFSLLPVGTPVSAPVDTRGDLVRVRVLDALWNWTGDHRCDAVHTQPVWVPASAIGTAYPG